MERSDWASWVQAIGSILAIAGAFWLGERQATHARRLAEHQAFETRRLEANKRHLDDRLRTEVVQQLFIDALSVVDNLSEARDRVAQSSAHDALGQAAELEQAFRALPLFEMPGSGVAVGVLLAPKLLADLREAASDCIDAWIGFSEHQLDSLMIEKLDLAHNLANHHFRTGIHVCEEQIAKLQALMPVED